MTMKSNPILHRILLEPAWLILIFAILQLSVALLVDGFMLSYDASVWHYIGRSWFRYGLTPYAGGIDNKSPFIFAIYGLSDILFGVNYWFPIVFGTACQSLSLLYLYKMARHLAGKQAGLWALQVYGLILMWYTTNGKYPSYTETYEVTCIIISFYIFLTAKQRYQLFLGGALAALGVAFRLTGVFSVFALGLASLRRRPIDALLFGLGFLVGIGLLTGIMVLCGIRLSDFVFYGFLDNLIAGGLTDHPLYIKIRRFTETFWYSEMLLLYPGVVAWLLMVKKLDLPILWAICTFACICGIGQYDPGHLKDLLPSLALMNGIVIGRAVEQYKLPAGKVALILWVVFIPKHTEPLSSFRALFRPPHLSNEKFCQDPKPDNWARKQVIAWIRSTTSPDDKVFFAGYEAQLQVYSERLSPTIYFHADAQNTKPEKAGFMKELASREPVLIVIPRFPEYAGSVDQDVRDFVMSIVSKDYNFDRCIYGYTIYRHK